MILALLGLGFGWFLGGNLFRGIRRSPPRPDAPRPPSPIRAPQAPASLGAAPSPSAAPAPAPVELSWYAPDAEPTVQFNDQDLAAIIAERDSARDSLRRVDRAWESERTRMRDEVDRAQVERDAALQALAERPQPKAEGPDRAAEALQAQRDDAAEALALALHEAKESNRQLRDENRLLIAQLDAAPTPVGAVDAEAEDWTDRLEAQAQALQLLQAQNEGLRVQLGQGQEAQERLRAERERLVAQDRLHQDEIALLLEDLGQLEEAGAEEAAWVSAHIRQRLAGESADPQALATLSHALRDRQVLSRSTDAAAARLQDQLAEVEGWAQTEAARAEELQAQLTAQNTQVAQLQEAQKADNDALSALQDDLAQREEERRLADEDQQRLGLRLAELETALAAALQDNRTEMARMKDLASQDQQARQALEERGRELTDAARAAQDRAADQGARLDSAQAQVADLAAQLQSSHEALARFKDERDRLKEELAAQRQRAEDVDQQLQRQSELERRYSERILQLERQLTLGRSRNTGAGDDEWKRIDSLWDDNKR